MDKASNNLNMSSEAGLITNNEELKIVMVGKTGVGKSASANLILGREAFVSKLSAKSMTTDCKKVKGLVNGQKVAVIDTPGLFDTRNDEKKTIKDLSQCISYASPGPHVFLVIIRLARFTDEEKKTVEKIQQVFGEAADQYSMVLFTGGDELTEPIEDFLDDCSDLQELVARCNNQYHVFNNKNKDDRSQVDELLQKIRNIVEKNGGSHYTNEMFQEAERAIEEEKQRILKEKEEETRRKQEEIRKKVEKEYEEKMKIKGEEMQRAIHAEQQRIRKEVEREARRRAEKGNFWDDICRFVRRIF
ncbi:GTPase IMAP family member 9-like [Betta splendens]|uniref:GTPase IMAP family member 9-like n=1 Tax=Betta splendens TaxID=158456 RepID=A0A6P7M4Q4_BETSP|nr:GTPase IMAP family member 9-like [Betta splendens]